MAMEMAAVLIPEAMLMVTGTVTVSPTQPLTEPIVVLMFGPAGFTVMEPEAVLLPPVQPPVMVTV